MPFVQKRRRKIVSTLSPLPHFSHHHPHTVPPLQLFGNGDVFSSSAYHDTLNSMPGLSGLMIGRGALIKPWIFTEVKECREWDISSKERLEGVRQYVELGLK